MDRSTNLPNLTGVLNFREMGGLRAAEGVVANGKLFRSGHLATATDDDVAALAALGLGSVVDFRQDVDREGDGGADRLPAGVDLVEIPVTDPAGVGAELRELLMIGDAGRLAARYGEGRAEQEAIANTVAQAIDGDKQAVYAAFLAHVADAEEPVLFHCSAGKDRAGWAATVLGMALGVDDDQLVEHYVESNVYRPIEERLQFYRDKGVDVDVMTPFLRVDETYLRSALAAIDDRWSSRKAYLAEALGVGDAEREHLQTRYLV